MQENARVIRLKVTHIDDHGTRELVRLGLAHPEPDDVGAFNCMRGTITARGYDVRRAGIREGDVVALRIVPEFEDRVPDDIGVVKVRAKVRFFVSADWSSVPVPEPPDSRLTYMFLADWMP